MMKRDRENTQSQWTHWFNYGKKFHAIAERFGISMLFVLPEAAGMFNGTILVRMKDELLEWLLHSFEQVEPDAKANLACLEGICEGILKEGHLGGVGRLELETNRRWMSLDMSLVCSGGDWFGEEEGSAEKAPRKRVLEDGGDGGRGKQARRLGMGGM